MTKLRKLLTEEQAANVDSFLRRSLILDTLPDWRPEERTEIIEGRKALKKIFYAEDPEVTWNTLVEEMNVSEIPFSNDILLTFPPKLTP